MAAIAWFILPPFTCPHLNTKRQEPRDGSLSVQTIPNNLPEFLINLSCQGPHLMGATLSTLLRAVHPGTIAMTDFRQGLRPKVLTRHLGDLWTLHVISCSDDNIVLGIRHYGSTPLILKGRTLVAIGPSAYGSSPWVPLIKIKHCCVQEKRGDDCKRTKNASCVIQA